MGAMDDSQSDRPAMRRVSRAARRAGPATQPPERGSTLSPPETGGEADVNDDVSETNMGVKPDTPGVFRAMAKVQMALAKIGVGKTGRNEQQKYNFRGIDQFYNAIAPELASAGLLILPRCLNREVSERKTASGGTLFYTIVTMEFTFIAAEDGSRFVVGPMYGEAMDSGDKSTNKAMSAAYKYAVMQAFSIPVEGQNVDSERDTHEPVYEYNEHEKAALQLLRNAAMGGTQALREQWKKLGKPMTTVLAGELDSLKAGAAQADEEGRGDYSGS
jgi:hypothetical protein